MHQILIALYCLPSTAIAALSVALAVAISFGAPWLAHRFLPIAPNHERSESAIDTIKLIGPLTAIFTAFLLLQAVNRLNEGRQLVETQAMNILQLDRSLSQAKTPQVQQARGAARAYAVALVDYGWPALRAAISSPEVDSALAILSDAVDEAAKSSPGNTRFLQSISADLGTVGDVQAQIQAAAHGGLPPLFWLVELTLLLLLATQMAMVGPNWAVIFPLSGYYAALGLLIGLLFSLDHPFVGDQGAEPAPIQRAIAQLELYDRLGAPSPSNSR